MTLSQVPVSRDSEPTPARWPMGGALLIAVAALLVGILRLDVCPECRGAGGMQLSVEHPTRIIPCDSCSDTGRVSLLKSWALRSAKVAPPAR